MNLGTYNIRSIRLPITINVPRSCPRGSVINVKVSAIALRAYASKHIIIVRGGLKNKKIIDSFLDF